LPPSERTAQDEREPAPGGDEPPPPWANREPYFDLDGELLKPRPHARGPWSPDMLSGRVVAALLAREVERRLGDPAFQVARFTVDLFRSPPLKPVTVSARPVREGKRIRVVDASMTSDGVEIGRASTVMLRRTEQPPGVVWSPPAWDMPPPNEGDSPWGFGRRGGGGGPPRAGDLPVEQRRTWMRDANQLVAGEALTPFVRVALAVDLTNPFANTGSDGLHFINADITTYLHRLPVSEWLGFQVSSHQSAEGIAVGSCTLYDAEGAIGQSLVCAVANRRPST
jgi:hypothetical protein